MTFEDTLARLGMTVVNPEQNNHFNMLIHGVSGVGKTSLAATASQVDDMSPVLYVDFESGTLPVREWGTCKTLPLSIATNGLIAPIFATISHSILQDSPTRR